MQLCWRISVVMLVLLACVFGFDSRENALAEAQLIADSDAYFPDQRGYQWKYRGRIIAGQIEHIADEFFENISTVKGEDTIDGVRVTVFHDTNPGDQGPSDSFYRRDAAGIQYYGSRPGTELERQLVPYQIIHFPIELASSFQQLDRKNLDLGFDLDRDGRNEQVDVQAMVTVVGKASVQVPYGVYPDAIQVVADMHLTVHLSETGRIVNGKDTMTAWFVKGVGLVKYIERQVIPMAGSLQERLIQITEELEDANVTGKSPSLSGRESTAKGILAHYTRHHKLRQIAFPSGFLPHPR